MHRNDAFKALADPTRREILRLLRRGEMTAGELADGFGISKPSMSHHFAVLKAADLITARRAGQQIYYSLNTTVVQALFAGLFLFFAVLGNVIGKVRSNFWMGVRTPWTLASPKVWERTHRLAAWLWVTVSIVGFVAVLLL